MPQRNTSVGWPLELGLVYQSRSDIQTDRAGVAESRFTALLRNEQYPELLPDVGDTPSSIWPALVEKLAAFEHLSFDGSSSFKLDGHAPGIGILELLFRGASFPGVQTYTDPEEGPEGIVIGSTSVPFFYNSGNAIGYYEVTYRAITRRWRYVEENKPATPRFALQRTTAGNFTADDTTNILTLAAHGITPYSRVRVTSTTTLPGGLSADTDYFVRDVTTNTFKLAATRFGAAIDITTAGTGTHSILWVPPPRIDNADATDIVFPYYISFGGGVTYWSWEPQFVLTQFELRPCGNYWEVIEADQVRLVETVVGKLQTGA